MPTARGRPHTGWGGRPLRGMEPRAPRGSNGPENPSPREWGSTGSSLVGSSGRGVWVPWQQHATMSVQPWFTPEVKARIPVKFLLPVSLP